jgi:PD-(D/E)XK nuclease superfamily
MDVDSDDQVKAVLGLLEKAEAILREEKGEDKATARRFNVFYALGVERAERAHSRFLACLLDPQGLHDQEDLFLSAFLRDVIREQAELSDLTKSEVRTEVPIWSGQLDVLVILPDGQMVALENKVDADEGDAQLERYRKWLHSRPQSKSGRPHHLVFLTPEGRLPLSCSSPDIKCISYGCITDWLHNLNLKDGMPDPLRIVIDQYVNLWRGIPMNSEMNALVRDPKNFETAESISKAVEVVKKNAKEQFLDQVQQNLKRSLDAEHLDSNWEVLRTPHTESLAGCGLVWKDRKRDLPNKAFSLQQFTVLCEVQSNNWNGEDIIVGICRGAKIQKDSQVEWDKKISERFLSNRRFEPWWPGFVKLKDLDGGRTIVVKDLILEVDRLSRLVAEKLWELFKQHRTDLENLNRNYPYALDTRIPKEEHTIKEDSC